MAKSFELLRKKMSDESLRRSEEITSQLKKQMPLQELRQARKITQDQMAQWLELNQASISKLEHRTDAYISTIRSYIEAMGGQLEIIAHFPEGDVVINQFHELEVEA